jgi:cytochrome P450
MNSPAESRRGDFLDQIIADMDKEKFLTEDFTVNLIFGILFASFESISAALTLSLKLIGDHPSVLEELTVSLCSLYQQFNC